MHTPKGGVVAESWVLSFCFLFFLFFWILVLFSHCRKTNNEPENKKPKKKNKIAHPKGGSSGRELGLVIFFIFLDSGFV